MSWAVDCAGATDIGRARCENQDRWYADSQLGLYMIADGMGGSLGGKLAADIVVEVLPRLLRQRLEVTAGHPDAIIVELVDVTLSDISNRLREESKRRFGSQGIGSTVVLVILRGREAIVAHMGDSRTYLLRGNRLTQVTKDHNVAQYLVDSGAIAAADVENHPCRSQLTRYVGMHGKPLPDVRLLRLQSGDRLFLCSHGLYSVVKLPTMEAILGTKRSATEVCRDLIAAANEAGGEDNITALVVAISEGLQ